MLLHALYKLIECVTKFYLLSRPRCSSMCVLNDNKRVMDQTVGDENIAATMIHQLGAENLLNFAFNNENATDDETNSSNTDPVVCPYNHDAVIETLYAEKIYLMKELESVNEKNTRFVEALITMNEELIKTNREGLKLTDLVSQTCNQTCDILRLLVLQNNNKNVANSGGDDNDDTFMTPLIKFEKTEKRQHQQQRRQGKKQTTTTTTQDRNGGEMKQMLLKKLTRSQLVNIIDGTMTRRQIIKLIKPNK